MIPIVSVVRGGRGRNPCVYGDEALSRFYLGACLSAVTRAGCISVGGSTLVGRSNAEIEVGPCGRGFVSLKELCRVEPFKGRERDGQALVVLSKTGCVSFSRVGRDSTAIDSTVGGQWREGRLRRKRAFRLQWAAQRGERAVLRLEEKIYHYLECCRLSPWRTLFNFLKLSYADTILTVWSCPILLTSVVSLVLNIQALQNKYHQLLAWYIVKNDVPNATPRYKKKKSSDQLPDLTLGFCLTLI